MEPEYKIYRYTIPKLGKERNGDHHLCELIDDNMLLVAIVSDGVSKQPCDWLASEKTCQEILANLKNNKDEPDLKKRILNSIVSANESVIKTEAPCAKMAATVSMIVWPIGSNKIYFSNIGDSRIYSSFLGKLALLTKDDSIVTKQKIHTSIGSRIVDQSVLTKAMGQPAIAIPVYEKQIEQNEIIILATDGFYDSSKGSFTKKMSDASLHENFSLFFQETINVFQLFRDDDFTVIALQVK